MLNPQDLIRDGKLLPEAIEHAPADPGELVQALGSAGNGPSFAALAMVAGLRGIQQAAPALLAGLSREDHGGKAAAWALARLDSERAVIDAIASGGLDVRENGYYSLSVRAALGKASPQVATAMAERVAAEIARAKQKMTGLGEHALRPLAILGAPGTDALIQQVLEADPYTDKFELQRLRKAVADGSRDQDSQRELAGPWVALFADHVYAPPAAPAPAPAPAPAAIKAPPATKSPPVAKSVTPSVPTAPPSPMPEGGEDELVDEPAGPEVQPIDWKEFLASPEATALPAAVKTLVTQLGPLLEQLAVRAINAPLTDLSGQEFAALLLQVLPQALPPQHVQAALSPQALIGYQALLKYLARTGLATHGDEIVQGLKLVREQLRQQMRQAGILNGPDYSDPDEVVAPKV